MYIHACLLPVLLALTITHIRHASATTITNSTQIATSQEYDYVIVGAGLTGITVGNKLSGAGYSVLIIEAGPDARWNPAVYNAEDRRSLNGYCNWQYPAYDDEGKLLEWKIDSGACIGGSTSINGMMWYRPTEAEINKLETLGNPGWNWDALVPVSAPKEERNYGWSWKTDGAYQYMKAIERNTPPDEIQISQGAGYDPAVHGYSGAINVSFPTPMRIPGAQKLYKEALPLVFPGLTIGNDLSNRTSIVSASASWTIWYDPVSGKNRRSSAADGLLWAAGQQRDSLTILANHKVDKVLFDKKMNARGIRFGINSTNELSTVYARREIILAAGTLGSAPILERSGVGKASVLKTMGIKQLVDLPGVGANLNDQPGTASSALVADAYQNDTSIIDNRSLFAPEISLVNVDEIWGLGAYSYVNDLASPEALLSRAQALVDVGAAVTVEGAQRILNTTIDLIVNSRLPVAEFIAESYQTVLSAVFWPSMPLSRGHVHIASADPFQNPLITPRLLTDKFDQDIAVAITRRSRALFSSPPFAGVVADAYYDPPIAANGTDADYLAWFEGTAYGASHWIGTTAMMPRELGGVVNPKLQVYGTKKLRVVDAGILSFQITSHTMSLLYAVAQKAAYLITEDSIDS